MFDTSITWVFVFVFFIPKLAFYWTFFKFQWLTRVIELIFFSCFFVLFPIVQLTVFIERLSNSVWWANFSEDNFFFFLLRFFLIFTFTFFHWSPIKRIDSITNFITYSSFLLSGLQFDFSLKFRKLLWFHSKIELYWVLLYVN